MLKISSVSIGYIATNCYLITDEKSGKSALIDPGRYVSSLETMLKNSGVTQLEYILITHGHFDHVMGVAECQRRYGGKIVVHSLDEENLHDPRKACAQAVIARKFECSNADITVCDGDELPLGETVIRVLHTPGHTQGSVCYLADDIMFSGDMLFRLCIGRTDFPGGDREQMQMSLQKLFEIPENYRVFPGHGGQTDLLEEKKYNPYFGGCQ